AFSCFPPMTSKVSISEACAYSEGGVAFRITKGLSVISIPPTNQSKAFFMTPGTPWAYSGLDTSNTSQEATSLRQAATTGGSPFSSTSGLKWGRSSRGGRNMTVHPEGARRCTARRARRLEESARKLPDTASRFMDESFLCQGMQGPDQRRLPGIRKRLAHSLPQPLLRHLRKVAA